MRKQKACRPYFFLSKTHEQIAEEVNKELPISLKHNEDLINRIHARYPLIEKSQISIIVTFVFESIRELLVLGKVINFNKLFFATQLLIFDRRRGGHILPCLKIKIGTPFSMRKPNEQ